MSRNSFTLLALLCAFAVASGLLSAVTEGSRTLSSPQEEFSARFYRPGFVTHVRYTAWMPPWPRRSDAWIDHDNSQSRSWDVQATDQWDNPLICTSMSANDEYYYCLPDIQTFPASEVAVPPFLTKMTELEGDAQMIHEDFQGTLLTRYRWDATLPKTMQQLEEGYCDGEEAAEFYYEFSFDESEVPFMEVLGARCRGIDKPILVILYHAMEFVDAHTIADDFFDPVLFAERSVSGYLSPLEEQLGAVYWLGLESNGYFLTDINWCNEGENCVDIHYSPPFDEKPDEAGPRRPEMELRIGTKRVLCENEEPIESALPNLRLCSRYDHSAASMTYSAYWTLSGDYFGSLSRDWRGEQTREEFLSLLNSLRVYDGPAFEQQTFLTEEQVRLLVADELEVVCPDEREAIRQHRDTATFTYDEASGEWSGTYGPFGGFAIPDAKPAVIPVAERSRIAANNDTYPIGAVECAQDNQE